MTAVYEALSNTIRSRFKTLVQDAIPVPVQYANRTNVNPHGTAWIDCGVMHEDTELLTAGGTTNRYRLFGHIKATIHVPLNLGDKEARDISSVLYTSFQGKTASSVVYRTPSLGKLERTDKWHVYPVMVPFYFDHSETRPASVPGTTTLSQATVGNVIRSHFKTNIADALSVSVLYDNAPFVQPDTWIRHTILESQGRTVQSSPVQRHRHPGRTVSQIFIPYSQGEEPGLDLGDSIASAYRAVTIDGILFRTPTLKTVGRSGKWWQINVDCPFWYETTST